MQTAGSGCKHIDLKCGWGGVQEKALESALLTIAAGGACTLWSVRTTIPDEGAGGVSFPGALVHLSATLSATVRR